MEPPSSYYSADFVDLETKEHNISSGSYGVVSFDSYNPSIAIKKSPSDTFTASARETAILTFLNHPNIIKPLSINYSSDGVCKMHMTRYIGNLSGNDWIAHSKKLRKSPMPMMLRILGEISAAMKYMHGCGIIHADLKPQNILFEVVKIENPYSSCKTNPWKIKPIICDFGISVIDNSKYSITMVQTLTYRAPEIDHKYPNTGNIMECAISEKIDIWSFGCIAFELFSGNLFMQAKSEKFPSWLVCATIFDISSDSGVNIKSLDLETQTKAKLFELPPEKILNAIQRRMNNSTWKHRLSLENGNFISKVGGKCDISAPVFDLMKEIIVGCLQPNPYNRWDSDKLFNFFKIVCGEIIDLSLSPEIENPIMHDLPRFKIDFFENIVDSQMENITERVSGENSGKYIENTKNINDYMIQYDNGVNLMRKIIEQKYYEKKQTKRILGTKFAFKISIASCMIAAILLEMDEIRKELYNEVDSSAVFEIASELGGDFL